VHPVLTASAGAGARTRVARGRAVPGVLGFVAAVGQHVLWNGVASPAVNGILCNGIAPGGACRGEPDVYRLVVTVPAVVAAALTPASWDWPWWCGARERPAYRGLPRERRYGRGASSTATSPWRRQPIAASQVRGADTGGRPDGARIDVRHPVNHAADERGSRPRTALRCFRNSAARRRVRDAPRAASRAHARDICVPTHSRAVQACG
jgi:hypothetical protein